MPADAKVKHMEPRAYLNGWGTKFVIERQINGDPELSFKGPDAKAPIAVGAVLLDAGRKTSCRWLHFTKTWSMLTVYTLNASGEVKVARDYSGFLAAGSGICAMAHRRRSSADEPSSGFLVEIFK